MLSSNCPGHRCGDRRDRVTCAGFGTKARTTDCRARASSSPVADAKERRQVLDGLLLWHLGAAAALELLPACDGGNADAALVRPLLHGANEGRWFEVPSLALPLPIVTVAFASPMPAVALVDTMVRAYLCAGNTFGILWSAFGILWSSDRRNSSITPLTMTSFRCHGCAICSRRRFMTLTWFKKTTCSAWTFLALITRW